MSTPIFTESERERIAAAVAAAETQTAGEIVPYVVARCGRYEVAAWKAGSIGALLVGAVLLAVSYAYDGWGLGWLYTGWAVALAMTAGGVLGALSTLIEPVRRRFAGAPRMAERVHRRAALAFVDEQVFDTRDRTGILLFVSLFEHRIEVLGDAGINAKVQPEEWVDVVALVRDGIRTGDLAGGLVAGIEKCGELLHRRGVAIRPDDTDELPDGVRVRNQ
jgi:putative membrane protein